MVEHTTQQAHKNVTEELISLHHVLDKSIIAEPCTEQKLRLLTKEIELVIATGKTPDKALSESLEPFLIEYAQEHPAIAQALRQVINALGNMGI